MRKLLFLILLAVAPALHAQTRPTTVIVVRHAEKQAQPADDPPLSAEGDLRAEALLEAVRHAGITAIYSTPYERTRATARPIATALNLPIIETPIPNRSVPEYAADIAARVQRTGGVVLVVGHSNTGGAVIKALGGPDVGPIVDERYDDLFVLTVQDGQPTRLVQTKYGRRWEAVRK